MCGVAGFVQFRPAERQELEDRARRMAGQLAHRGPDDAGSWAEPEAGAGLGFRRLSIIDLSPAGHQPMCSASGRYVIVFNGEVYNFADLRAELEPLGHRFRGHSDTEVMLAAIEHWGLETAVRRFRGMFAFALWDGRDRVLHLVRDRLGIKPLYYGFADAAGRPSGQGARAAKRVLLFASELKAMRAYPGFAPEIDRDALAVFLRHTYIPSPYSIYRGVAKLPPGCIISFPCGGASDPGAAQPRAWWSFRQVAEEGENEPFVGPMEEAQLELEQLLRESIRLRMIADVPLGAFLSGGIDSSIVVALMQAESTRPVQTFTVGFGEAEFNEAAHARRVAEHLHTDHHEIVVTPEQARAVIPKLATMYDEPFADSSQIPTHLVSTLARSRVTVSLSGDGADELFGGYNYFSAAPPLWNRLRSFPWSLRRLAAAGAESLSPGAYNRLLRGRRVAPTFTGKGTGGQRIHKAAQALRARDICELHRAFATHWDRPETVVINAREPSTVFVNPSLQPMLSDASARMMANDALMYLPDDILTKVDRASMAVSLEARVPVLDHRVVEFAARLPIELKIREGKGKWLLRQILYRHVPASIVERPKMGFGVPVGVWIRGPLREWAESLLDASRLKREGVLRPKPVRRLWKEHLNGEVNAPDALWAVLMFQSWLERWKQV
ncbi:MAG TPA: asparagine synthase (glutamine-hydrolyzing) [Terriglobia bacterium]|nr:asparagine synthase (glutamine-hydrolyzing) [Terriglobia bacterium]